LPIRHPIYITLKQLEILHNSIELTYPLKNQIKNNVALLNFSVFEVNNLKISTFLKMDVLLNTLEKGVDEPTFKFLLQMYFTLESECPPGSEKTKKDLFFCLKHKFFNFCIIFSINLSRYLDTHIETWLDEIKMKRLKNEFIVYSKKSTSKRQ